MLGHCWALITLKLMIWRHTWTFGKWVSVAVVLFLGCVGILAAAGSAAGMVWTGKVLSEVDAAFLLMAMDGFLAIFLLIWCWGILIEIQRSDVIDFRTMLYLPISLRMVYTMNYLASLLTPALFIFVPGALGLVAGLGARHGIRMALGAPLVVMFFLMVSVWAYYARGVLAILMENKRRRRLILTLLPMAFVVMGYMPSVLVEALQGKTQHHDKVRTWLAGDGAEELVVYANLAIPVGWLPYGVWGLTEGRTAPALWCFLGMTGIAALGLGAGYRSTLRHYRGEGRVGAATSKARAPDKVGKVLTSRRLLLLDEETSALTAAAFLGFARHPNIRILLIMPLCMGFFLLFMHRTEMGNATRFWIPVMVLVWPFFNFSFVMLNVFGIDQQSFRGLVLLPTPRHKILLSKNLALFPYVGGLSVMLVALSSFFVELDMDRLAIAFVQVFLLYLAISMVGNFTSLYFPYRIQRDSMRARENRPLMFLVGILSMGLITLLTMPVMVCLSLDELAAKLWGFTGWPLGLTVSIALLGLTLLAYRIALVHAGDLFLIREQRVLATLLKDRE